MANPVIVEAVRTPIGKRNGWLSGLHASHVLAAAQTEVVKRAGVEPAAVEQIVGGCVTQAGEQASNVTRTAWLSEGHPYETAATTIDSPRVSGGNRARSNNKPSGIASAGCLHSIRRR